MSKQVDVAIITFLPDELQAVLNHFPDHRPAGWEKGRWLNIGSRTGRTGTHKVAIVAAGEQGTGEAQAIARHVIAECTPEWVLAVGIAGGRPADEFSLGDVIVSTRIHDFSLRAASATGDDSYSLGGGPIHPDARGLIANLPAFSAALSGWSAPDRLRCEVPSLDPATLTLQGPDDWKRAITDSISRHFAAEPHRPPIAIGGEIGSSDTLVKDPEVLIPLLLSVRRMFAVEMESAGIYRAVAEATPTPRFLAVRGISDIVGLKRDDQWKQYACATAAAFAFSFIDLLPLRTTSAADYADKRGTGATILPSPDDADRELRVRIQRARDIQKQKKPRAGVYKVNRDELESLIAAARASAKDSIVSLGGDLSWLRRDLPVLRALRVSRPRVQTILYYDDHRVNPDAVRMFREIKELGIQLRRSPHKKSRMKAILVDWDRDEPSAYVFRRVGGPTANGDKPTDFHWRAVRRGEWGLWSSLNALVSVLQLSRVQPFVVGISGVNNVGKSTLALLLRDQLESSGFTVDLVEDVFRGRSGHVSIEENYLMLWLQREREHADTDASIRLLDRTLVDNACFLKLRGGEQAWTALAPEVARHAKAYDLLIDVRLPRDDYSSSTTHTTGQQRMTVRGIMDNLFTNHLLRPFRIELDLGDPASLPQAAEQASNRIRQTLVGWRP